MRLQMRRWWFVLFLAAGACSDSLQAQEAKPAEPPLWQLPPFDRIELRNGETHDVDPVRIAPGVVFDAEADEYVGQPGLPPFRELKRPVRYRIRLVDGEEFYVHGRSIQKISLYEDMLLAKAKTLTRERKFDEAHDYYAALEARDPRWPGLLEARIEDRMQEGEQRFLAGDPERAFWALVAEKRLREELQRRPVPSTPQAVQAATAARAGFTSIPLQQRIEEVVNRWLDGLLAEQRYDEGRRVVARLEAVYPDSPLAKRRREEFRRRAEQVVEQASTLEKAGELQKAYATLRDAAQIDPSDDLVRSASQTLAKKYMVLRVAVDRLPAYRYGLSGWSRADWRAAELLHLPLMRLTSLADGGKFASRVVRSVERSDINRRATISIVDGLVWPGDGKPVSAVDVQRLLADSCRPQSPLYHPALARLVVNLQVQSTDVLQIDFDRPQFQPSAWLQIPFLRMSYDSTAPDPLAGGRIGASGLGPYRLGEIVKDHAEFSASPRFLEPDKPLCKRVVERVYENSAQRLRALQDGEVDLVATVPARHYAQVPKIQGARLVSMSVPRMHVLQFNLHKRELRHRTLRRAIDLAIDRSAIFSAVEIKQDDKNRIVTGPLPFGSLGYNDQIKPRPYDPLLAKALVLGVRKEMGGLGVLRFMHSGDETSRAAAEMIARSLERVGLSVSLFDRENQYAADPLDADIRYESYTVSDPLYDVITLLTRDNPTLAQHGSPWFRQLLVELIETPNLSTAARLLPQLHEVLFDDATILPLWQWTDCFAISDAVGGSASAPPSLYHRIADWTVQPRFPPAEWDLKRPGK